MAIYLDCFARKEYQTGCFGQLDAKMVKNDADDGEDDNQIKEVKMVDQEIQENVGGGAVASTNQSYIQSTQETLVHLFRFL